MRASVVVGCLAISILFGLSGTASATPGAIATPPIAAELGANTAIGATSATLSSTELRVGASWASLYWKPTFVDVSIGYVGSYRTLVTTGYEGSDGTAIRTTSGDPNELRLHGMYLDLAYAIENHRHWRTWVGVRGETLSGEHRERSIHAIGGALRLGAEVYSAGVGGASGSGAAAVFFGTFGVGFYVEGTARTLPKELGVVGVGAGVSVRLPFFAAIGA